MIQKEWAQEFAEEWCAAWNAGDLMRIFSHYADDFEMTSPLIVERMGVASGVLKGKDAIRPYWSAGLAARPKLHFELLDVSTGVNSIAIRYHSRTRGKIGIEHIVFDARRKGVCAEALNRDA